MENKSAFKIGDWLYALKSAEDFRSAYGEDKYIPIFQLKDISSDGGYMRPVYGEGNGVHYSHCRLATQEEILTAGGIINQISFNYLIL